LKKDKKNTSFFCTIKGCLIVNNKIFFVLILFILYQIPVYAQDANQKNDQIRKKYKNRSTWEMLVSLPGTLIYLPVKILSYGISESVEYVDENKVVQKTQDFLTSDDELRGVLPTYGPRKGGGLKYFQKDLFTFKSKFSISATVGSLNRQRYQLRLRRVQINKLFSIDFLGRYHFLPDEMFFGFGMDTDFKKDRSNYAYEQSTFETSLCLNVNDKFTTKLITGFEMNNILNGRNKRYVSTTDIETKDSLPGLTTRIKLMRLQFEVRHDSNNRFIRPTSGGIALFRGGIFKETGKNQFGFWKATLDLSYNLHLIKNRTFLLRVAGETTRPLSDYEIPFYYLSSIGQQETIRGFQRSRFRHRDMVLSSVEYRYPIWIILDAFLFFDAGIVDQNMFKNSIFDNVKFGFGGGFQVWGNEGVASSITFGFCEDGFRFYFGLNREL